MIQRTTVARQQRPRQPSLIQQKLQHRHVYNSICQGYCQTVMMQLMSILAIISRSVLQLPTRMLSLLSKFEEIPWQRDYTISTSTCTKHSHDLHDCMPWCYSFTSVWCWRLYRYLMSRLHQLMVVVRMKKMLKHLCKWQPTTATAALYS